MNNVFNASKTGMAGTLLQALLIVVLLIFISSCQEKITEDTDLEPDQLSPPAFHPCPDTVYYAVQKIELSSPEEGTVIRYTTDESEPTAESPRYVEPVPIEEITTIKARSYKEGWEPSKISSAEYVLQAAAPEFDPPGADYDEPQWVEISSPSADVSIRYTTDGSKPDTLSTLYTEPVLINEPLTLKARAFRSGWQESEVAAAEYKTPPVADPVFNPPGATYHNKQKIYLTCATENAVIRYTTNGEIPTDTSKKYTEPILIRDEPETVLKAKAFKENWAASKVVKEIYHLQAASPVFDPPAGNYPPEQEITIDCETVDAVIRYTIDGSEPKENSSEYTVPLQFSEDTTVKAKAFKDNWHPSVTSTSRYTFSEIAPPQFDPSGGVYDDVQFITITSETPDTVVRYTLDGSEPTYWSMEYQMPVRITENSVLKAKAFVDEENQSSTTRETYVLQAVKPYMNPEGGDYHTAQNVRIISPTDNTEIRYTTDGSEPTSSSSLYTGPVTVFESQTLKARAFKANWKDSEIGKATYNLIVSTPKFEPPGGYFGSKPHITISCANEEAAIRYTTDGSEPDADSPLYSEPILIDGHTTLKAKALIPGWSASEVHKDDYLLRVDQPVFHPEGGDFHQEPEITIACETEGAVIRYTTDGSEPTADSPQYTSPLKISEHTTLKAKGFKPYWYDSEVQKDKYNLKAARPVFDPPGVHHLLPQYVTITALTEGVTIRYTTDGSDPTPSSPKYTKPVFINRDVMLKARAYKPQWYESAVASTNYRLKFTRVEGGTFRTGNNYNVTLSSFYIAKYLVTQQEFEAVMGYNPSHFSDENPHNPVERVSWFHAIAYCNRRSMREGLTPVYTYSGYGTNPGNWPEDWHADNDNHTNISFDRTANGYRLPTEMEWMFAAMGGNKSQGYLYSGSNNINEVAWYNDNAFNRTRRVGTKEPNELEIYDMSGNVWELCWDIYHPAYPDGNYNNPTGPEEGTVRVKRGGSWANSAGACEVEYRAYSSPNGLNNHIGFRVVSNVP